MSGAPTPPVTPPAAAGGGSRASVPGEPPSAELLREGDDRGAAGGWSLGPFRCLRRIGRGAMGEVWRAAHQLTGGEVAIKLLKPESGADPWSTEAFAAEVRAAASLSHPGVVQIIDHGAVTAADEGCPLPVGTPWLAMELVLGRPLGRFIGALSWAQIRDLLLQLLDALAHLHARGVLHRDIKPGNVILRAPGGGVPAPRVSTGPLDALLTDFGLAQRIGHPGPTDALVAGTPAYMAPEQLEARWRDQGPWTDLYSLGCVAWAMVTGDAPFGRDSTVEDSRRAHLSDKPPALQPLVPVPPGLEAWLRQLLHKQPERRFARAADAAWALLTLSASALRVGSPDAPRALQTLDISLWRAIGDEGEADEPTVPPRPGPPGERTAPRVVFGRRAERRRTPMPRGWRTPRPPPRSSPLRDVGLRLLGQRPRQLVGRTDAQDTLWGALSAVHADGHMRVVVLSGAEGCGRSRLGDWLVERGDEVGAVRVVRVQHAETEPALKPGPSPWGLGGMVSRALRCEGLWGAELRARLLSLFPEGHALRDDIDGLVEEMEAPPTPPELGERPATFYPRARFTRLARLLESLGDRRGTGEGDAVLTLWVDDAHQGVDALELVRFLLETQESEALPLLVLLSVRLEALVQRPRALSLLGMISDDPATVTVSVRPLGDGDHLQLCADLLPLEPELAEQLAARSGGNPMFATRILESWAAQGELVPGPQGHRLRPDARLELPADLQATWADRLERLVAGMDEREQRALELAAALGAVIDRDEWTAACALGEGEASDRLMMRLFVGRFAEWSETPRGWSFSHAMLREVLLVRAQDLGRLRDHHRAIVALLEEQARAPGGPPPGHAERVGRHLLASGAALPALGALLEGARERLRRGEPAAARRVLAMRERALAALQLPQTEEPWGLGRLLMLELDALEGDPAELPTRLDAVEQAARRHRWTRVLPGVELLRLEHLRNTGELAAAVAGAVELRRTAREAGDAAGEGRALAAEAKGRLLRGELAIAAGRAREALQAALRGHDRHGAALCRLVLGKITAQEGHPDAARAELQLAAEELGELGDRWSVCAATSALADVARREGRLAEADAGCRAALALMEELDHPQASLARLNLAVLQVEAGDHVGARALIEPTLRALTIEGRVLLSAGAHLTLLAPLAWHGEWGAFDHHLDAARYILQDTGFVDRDNARMLSVAAETASRAGEDARAADALHLAAEQLRALGDLSGAQRLGLRAAALREGADEAEG